MHLVLSVLAYVLAIYMYCGARSSPGAVYVLAICIVGCLVRNLWMRGVALVKFQTFPISYGVLGHICILRDMYLLTRDKVEWELKLQSILLLSNQFLNSVVLK